jgi:hypothetical protein
MTDKEKLEAIQALINGEWDNPSLVKVGELHVDFEYNVQTILNL